MEFVNAFKGLERNLEKAVMLIRYVSGAAITFDEIVHRFPFHTRVAWSTMMPIYQALE